MYPFVKNKLNPCVSIFVSLIYLPIFMSRVHNNSWISDGILFLHVIWAILGPLHFHMNIRLSLSIWIFIGIVLNEKINLGNGHLNNIEFFQSIDMLYRSIYL